MSIYTRAPTCRAHGGSHPAVHCSRPAFRVFCIVHIWEGNMSEGKKKNSNRLMKPNFRWCSNSHSQWCGEWISYAMNGRQWSVSRRKWFAICRYDFFPLWELPATYVAIPANGTHMGDSRYSSQRQSCSNFGLRSTWCGFLFHQLTFEIVRWKRNVCRWWYDELMIANKLVQTWPWSQWKFRRGERYTFWPLLVATSLAVPERGRHPTFRHA